MDIDGLFFDYIQATRPKFLKFSNSKQCMFLTGGMAIRIITREYRKRLGKKLPSKDFDFTWAFSTKPTTDNFNQMADFTEHLGQGFVNTLGPGAKMIFSKRMFDAPVLQNMESQRYMYGHCKVDIKIGRRTYDLMDAVIVHLPGASVELLNKTMTNKYNLPLPKLRTLYIDTARLVKKTLLGDGYNAWRNPIKSTNPKHPAEYKKKGRKNVNRLVLIQKILNKQSTQNITKNVIMLDKLLKSRVPINKKLIQGKSIGILMNRHLQQK
jgi:hypothetical protein